MGPLFYTLFGAAFTMATAWAIGTLLLLRRVEERLIAIVVGSACLSTIVLAMCATGLARKGVFLALGLVAVIVAVRFGVRAGGEPLPVLARPWKWAFGITFTVLTVLYFLNAITPETFPGSLTQLLSTLNRAHGFQRGVPVSLPEGIDLLFFYAFVFGRHAAVALVNLGLLISLTLLVLGYGRRIGHPAAGVAAAILTYVSAWIGRDFPVAHIEAATAVVLFALFYLLQVWDVRRAPALLVPIGILTGFSYAAKYSAIIAVPCALGFIVWKLWRARQPLPRPVLTFSAATFAFMVPWIILGGFRSPDVHMLLGQRRWLVPFAALALTLGLSNLSRFVAAAQALAKTHYPRFRKLPWVAIVIAAVCLWFVSHLNRSVVLQDYFRLEQAWMNRWPPKPGKWSIENLVPTMWKIGVLRPARIEVEPGISFVLDPRDLISISILRGGAWQPEVWDSISPSLTEGGVFLDVGAHIGYFSMKAAPVVGKTGHVLSFEPNPETLVSLRDNVAANHAWNVIVEPIACTDREQMLTLYAGPPSNTGMSSLASENVPLEGPPRLYTVRGRMIDDVVRELKLTRVDAIKIDVEGAEAYVLRGAVNTLKRFHPKVVVEVVPSQLAALQSTPDDVTAVLKGAGYNHSQPLNTPPTDWEWTVQPQAIR